MSDYGSDVMHDWRDPYCQDRPCSTEEERRAMGVALRHRRACRECAALGARRAS